MAGGSWPGGLSLPQTIDGIDHTSASILYNPSLALRSENTLASVEFFGGQVPDFPLVKIVTSMGGKPEFVGACACRLAKEKNLDFPLRRKKLRLPLRRKKT